MIEVMVKFYFSIYMQMLFLKKKTEAISEYLFTYMYNILAGFP